MCRDRGGVNQSAGTGRNFGGAITVFYSSSMRVWFIHKTVIGRGKRRDVIWDAQLSDLGNRNVVQSCIITERLREHQETREERALGQDSGHSLVEKQNAGPRWNPPFWVVRSSSFRAKQGRDIRTVFLFWVSLGLDRLTYLSIGLGQGQPVPLGV